MFAERAPTFCRCLFFYGTRLSTTCSPDDGEARTLNNIKKSATFPN